MIKRYSAIDLQEHLISNAFQVAISDERWIKEADHIKEVERLKELVIWMTGCGYDFTQHDFYMKEMQDLIWSEQVSLPGDSDVEPPEDV